jgi:outer membrane protein assembly factor BamA
MDTEKNDYTILNFNQYDEDYWKLNLSLFDRRAEIFIEYSRVKATLDKILDNEENIQSEFDDPSAQTTEMTTTGLVLDYTDDYMDAKKGVRLEVQRSNSPPTSEDDSDFFVIDKELKIYVPIGDYNVLAFHAMYSDAEVNKMGVTDPDKIANELGLDCDYNTCSQTEKNLIDRTIVEREKGTATTLGGYNLLRSYPLDRFQGAHMRYYSTEFRFNFANEVTPFDFWIWKDISTSLQWAFFYDWGTVAETEQDLWEKTAYSIGTGFRLVAASGYVYRVDWAMGKEGSNVTMVFEYPW